MNAYEEVMEKVQWVLDNYTSYRVAQALGINARTINRYQNGESPVENMKAETLGKIYNYYLDQQKETVNMNKIKQAIEYGLNEDLIKALTEEETIDAAIEELAEMYEGSELTVEQFVFEKAEEEGIVKDEDAYEDNDEGNADGYYWFDEVSKWIKLS